MELVTRLALTASIITALILIAGRFGEHVAGLLSGLPFMTAPALLQIGAQSGAVSAAEAALGGVVGCALASLFALAYYAAAGRLSRTATLAFALGFLTAGLTVCSHMPPSLTWAAAMACGCSAIALCFIGNHSAGADRASTSNRQRARPALAIGLASAVVTTLAAEMHPWLAGPVTAMPIIGVVTVASCHRTRGVLAVPAFLRAYVLGSLVKTAFCATFALCVMAHGVFLALLFAALVSVATGTFMLGFRTALATRPSGSFFARQRRLGRFTSPISLDKARSPAPADPALGFPEFACRLVCLFRSVVSRRPSRCAAPVACDSWYASPPTSAPGTFWAAIKSVEGELDGARRESSVSPGV